MLTPEPRDAQSVLAEVLAEHPVWERGPARGLGQCAGCGYVHPVANAKSPGDWHRAHVAAMQAAALGLDGAQGASRRPVALGDVAALEGAQIGAEGIETRETR